MSSISEKDFVDIFLTPGVANNQNYGISHFTRTLRGQILNELKGNVVKENSLIRTFIRDELLPYENTDTSDFSGSLAGLPSDAKNLKFIYPLDQRPSGISSYQSFGKPNPARTKAYGYNRNHDGVDLALGKSTPVYAIETGTVVLNSWVGAYGNRIVISHTKSGSFKSTYSHLSSSSVKNGQGVVRGQVIGMTGNSGVTNLHLHFEISKNGKYVNPLDYIGNAPLPKNGGG